MIQLQIKALLPFFDTRGHIETSKFFIDVTGAGETKTGLEQYLLSRKQSTSFSLEKRWYDKDDLAGDCCYGSCHYEELDEYAEVLGWPWVKETICELSVRERYIFPICLKIDVKEDVCLETVKH